ncbi:MAG: carbon-nitrogen hydrolase family protein [Bacteroidota bacterium]|nr:carbon-nitrogen hydrolase family protein [Rhodothermia bacterium]MCS7154334.1 carbon-nitrogen hydrolase family protein [Bacteroidota bacterium]MDW8137090.1 carbon-nitrogen hydrolase family protein [Bacteroidota bacterium]MDW8285039.1 carbon-nitrogen hydrolase family protein [Bacteroidota bacterium]
MTVAVLQPLLRSERPEENARALAQALESLRRVCSEDPLWVVLPEYWSAASAPALWTESEELRLLRGWARRLQIYLVGGSVLVRDEAGCLRNRAMVLDPEGALLGFYDKRCLLTHERRRGVEPGGGPMRLSVGDWRLSVVICADLWHPSLVPAEVDLLLVPAATVVLDRRRRAYARRLWRALGLVRAQERLCVLASSDWACSWDGRRGTAGASLIADPSEGLGPVRWRALERSLSGGRPGWLCKRLDRQRLEAFRAYRRERGLWPAPLLHEPSGDF